MVPLALMAAESWLDGLDAVADNVAQVKLGRDGEDDRWLGSMGRSLDEGWLRSQLMPRLADGPELHH